MLDADSCHGYGHWRLRPGLRGYRNKVATTGQMLLRGLNIVGGGRGPLAN